MLFPWPLPGPPTGWEPLAAAVPDHYAALTVELAVDGADPGYRRVGGLTALPPHTDPEPMAAALRAVRDRPGMHTMGEIAVLGPGAPAARFPLLRPELAGLWVEGVARVDGRGFRAALLAAADRLGVRRISGTARLRPARDDEDGIVVEIDGTVLGRGPVVVAAGAWSRELCRALGVALPVAPVRGQLPHLDAAAVGAEAWPTVRTISEHYLLGVPGERVVVGSTVEPDAGFAVAETPGGTDALRVAAAAVAPALEDAPVAETLIGPRPGSADGLPLLGPIGAGMTVATGLGAHGLTFGPYVGELAAELALGHTPAVDLRGYDPQR